MHGSKADSIYLTDDYPRDGCLIVVKLSTSGFVIEMRAPDIEPPIEIYGCHEPAAMLQVVECLATGKCVPRGYNRGDQSFCSGSMSTS